MPPTVGFRAGQPSPPASNTCSGGSPPWPLRPECPSLSLARLIALALGLRSGMIRNCSPRRPHSHPSAGRRQLPWPRAPAGAQSRETVARGRSPVVRPSSLTVLPLPPPEADPLDQGLDAAPSGRVAPGRRGREATAAPPGSGEKGGACVPNAKEEPCFHSELLGKVPFEGRFLLKKKYVGNLGPFLISSS